MKKNLKKEKKLLKIAQKAIQYAYAPYSKFKVGAAVIVDGGKVYSGTNIENASYRLTLCAEHVAIAKAVSQGHKSLKSIAIYARTKKHISPCGACRQVILEFGKNVEVITPSEQGGIRIENISDLLQRSFHRAHLNRK